MVRKLDEVIERRIVAAVLCLVGFAAAACTSAGGSTRGSTAPVSATAGRSTSVGTTSTGSTSTGSTSTGSTSSAAPARALPRGPLYYVSLGDSYAAGYQATGQGTGATTHHGFADQTVQLATSRGYDLRLVNFGCAGATTVSILHTAGCENRLRAPGAPAYTGTQASAAETFLRAHRGNVGLITVSIGGNDVIPCGVSADPLTCLTKQVATTRSNVTTLARALRAAAGPAPLLVGTTYPDVLLGNYLSPDPHLKSLAALSTTAFSSLINPALQAGYAAGQGRFVDVTAATGAYGPTTAGTTVPPYGRVPTPVAQICRLTYFCQYHDIHPRTVGYSVIARLVAAELPKR